MHINNFLFKNWSGTIQQKVPNFFKPSTKEEILEIIHKYDNIRFVGTGHSWSPLFETKEAMISFDNFNKIISIDKEKLEVVVQPGIKLWHLNNLLDMEGLALQNLGSIDEQSIAGAILTGTHGSGIQFQCLASQVMSISLIDGMGNEINLDRNDDSFYGALVSLGSLGVVIALKLKVCKKYQLNEITYIEDFDKILPKIDNYITENDHFKMWWLPPSKKWVIFTYKRTDKPINDSKWRIFFHEKVKSDWGYAIILFIGNLFNKLRPILNKYLTWEYRGPLNRTNKSYKVFKVPRPPKHRETEWAFDVKDAKALLVQYQNEFSKPKYSFNFIQEIRFTKGDDFWLSPCYKRDSIWIGMYNINVKNYDSDLVDFEIFAKANNGRPHWGKEFNVDRNYLEKGYPKYQAFIDLRKKMDPKSKFSNPFLTSLFE
ncbi:MAG: FAD-binding protein [Bacteroidetes bacterium]|nr:FAD-binding protein [Bacteroidota bacterium]